MERQSFLDENARYSNNTFSCSCPPDTVVINIEREEHRAWRLVHKLQGKFYEITFDLIESISAGTAAESLYKNASPLYSDENIGPHSINRAGGWRCKYRFVDGASAPFIYDTVFFEAPFEKTLRVQYVSRPENYKIGKSIFELVTNSLSFV